MPDSLPPLSTNEYALLQIMARGESIADLGEYSRWSSPLSELVKRGYAKALDKFNHVITEAGREAVGATEDDEIRSLITVNNAMIEARQGEREVLESITNACKLIYNTITINLPKNRQDEAWVVVRRILGLS
jgi:hypothetical protein